MKLTLPKSITLENTTRSFLPGIYLIKVQLDNSGENKLNKLKFRFYVGETNAPGGIAERLGKHVSELKNGTHYCKELLSDYKAVGIENFVFYALEISKELCDKEVRRAREEDYIKRFIDANISLYNKPNAKPTQEISVISIKGAFYVGIRNAALSTGESRSNIQRKLRDSANKDYFLVKTFPWRQHNFIKIGDKIYEGYQAIVEAGLASSVSSIEKGVAKGKVFWDKNKLWSKLTKLEKDEYIIEKALKG